MTIKFDPYNNTPNVLLGKYINSDVNNNFTLVKKKTRILSGWLLGKIIHWIFHRNERISTIREVYQKLIESDHSTRSVAECKNLLANVEYFNGLIKKHNDHWIYSILSRCKESLI